MCLAVPMEILDIRGQEAEAKVGESVYEINTGLLSDLNEGDYVIVHAGFAIEKLDKKEAKEKLKIWNKMKEEQESVSNQ